MVQTKRLITGKPGVGKTTCVEKIVRMLPTSRVVGFLTREVREQGARVGFQIEIIGNGAVPLARKHHRSPYRVGRYGVFVENVDFTVTELMAREKQLNQSPRIYVIDEIGKMEAYSARFREWVEAVLSSEWPVVATIALKGTPWIETLKQWPGIEILLLTEENRNAVCQYLRQQIHDIFSAI